MDSVAERDAAYDDIKADGLAITLKRNVQGTYNPDSGSISNDVPESYPSYALITDYTLFEQANSLVKQGDKKIILAATATMPKPSTDDTLVDATGTIWAIKNCNPVAPAGIPILYKIQATEVGVNS